MVPEATSSLKAVDAWWTVLFIDPFAVRLVKAVEHRSAITPTRLTVIAHVLGLLSAGLFAGGQLVPAALVFEIRFVIDCADGKLARVRGTSSIAGGFLDYVGDVVVVGANVVALSFHLAWHDELGIGALVGLPAAYLAAISTGQFRTEQAQALSVADPQPTAGRLPVGYRAWMAQHRLRALPSRVDAEHGLLFVLPVAAVVVDDHDVLVVGAWLGTAYFAYNVVKFALGGYHLAQERDRLRTRRG